MFKGLLSIGKYNGQTNSDGSVTAQTVLIGNGNMFFRRNGGGQPAPTGVNGG